MRGALLDVFAKSIISPHSGVRLCCLSRGMEGFCELELVEICFNGVCFFRVVGD